ncbi:MAG: SDR family NAD(P)-dependent oxidoreductase [Methylophilus sp.]|uniref:SDR family NAD(P)-dependent oxidoreductase n=1 Tax=Methylophilus sp. TaxID=29541 RepID=UPI003FA1097A
MSKFILVTGASTGIGFQTAKLLSEAGFQVICTVREEADKVSLARFSRPLLCDIASQSQIETLMEQVEEITGGKLYGVFLNAAYGQPAALLDLSEQVFHQQLDVNLISQHAIARRAAKMMIAKGEGRIVFNSSVLGITHMPLRGAYNASKFALEAYASTLRVELAHLGIEVSVIRPGPISTNFKRNALQAFRKNVTITNSLYQKQYKEMVKRLDAPFADSTVPASVVAKKVLHAFNADKPKKYYRATVNTIAAEFAIRFLPAFLVDKMVANRY